MAAIIKSALVRNMGWVGLANIVNRVFRLGNTVLLARILTTEDYGIIGLLFTIREFIAVFETRSGFNAKIIQCSDEELETTCNTSYYMTWIISIALFVIQCILAFPLAHIYNLPNLGIALCFLGLTYLINPTYAVQNGLIYRSNNLKPMAFLYMSQGLIGNIVTGALALLGFSYWSILISNVISASVWAILSIKFKPWKPTKKFTLEGWQDIFKFCKDVLGVELLDRCRNYIDYFLVGTFLGVEALGLYYFAFNAGIGISMSVISTFNHSFYPNISKYRDDIHQVKTEYFEGFKTIGLVIIPLVLLQSAAASFYVPIIFGEKWIPAIPILILICLSAIPRPFFGGALSLYQLLNQTHKAFRWSFGFTLWFIACVFLGLNFGAIGVAVSVLLSHYFFIPFATWFISKSIFKIALPN